jgi:hypothetical protein
MLDICKNCGAWGSSWCYDCFLPTKKTMCTNQNPLKQDNRQVSVLTKTTGKSQNGFHLIRNDPKNHPCNGG